jgi:hypothetical protein
MMSVPPPLMVATTSATSASSGSVRLRKASRCALGARPGDPLLDGQPWVKISGVADGSVRAEKALKKLQGSMRHPSAPGDQDVMRKRIPKDLIDGRSEQLHLLADEVGALAAAEEAVLGDLRFEHLGKNAKDAIWRFACRAYLERSGSHVPGFVEEHGRELFQLVCYVPIMNLTVEADTKILGLRLLSPSDPRIPQAPSPFALDPGAGSVAAVNAQGTSYSRMAERSRDAVSHTLRVLRVALRHRIGVEQLRFRLGRTYAFEQAKAGGWRQIAEAAYDLGLDDGLIALAAGDPVALLPFEPRNDVERKADLALRWMERAWFVGEPAVALLYLFFALEALLGVKSEGLKGHDLAFRQALLDHAATGSFTHPSATLFLYEDVRSAAVHGEPVPEVTDAILRRFRSDVAQTLGHYITYTREKRFTRRSHLLQALDKHPDRPDLVSWLREHGGSEWADFNT